MKAAVMYEKGNLPVYTDMPEPIVQQENQVIISMRASAIKHLDKSTASGKHYSIEHELNKAKIIGGDGVGILADGTRVYAIGETGMVAEKAVVSEDRIVPIPDGLDDATAAALPNAIMGSAMGLRYRAGMQGGETVLINGATGFTGKMAVQVAKFYGAKKIIATGRNENTLQTLLALGADEIISLKQDDETLLAQLKAAHQSTPFDIVIDYLWGHTAELILLILKGQGAFTHRTRFVSIGAVTGDTIQLSSQILRSVDLQLSGSGLGSWTKKEVQQLFSEILPEMFGLAAAKKLVADIITLPAGQIENLWDMQMPDGKRLVVAM